MPSPFIQEQAATLTFGKFMLATKLLLIGFVVLLTIGCGGRSFGQAKPAIDPTGEWEMTLPGGMKYKSPILRMDAQSWQIPNIAGASGIYEFQGNALVMLQPDNDRSAKVMWWFENSGKLVLIQAPPVSRTGSDYTGAVLQRVAVPVVPAPAPTQAVPQNFADSKYPGHTSGRRVYDLASLLSPVQTSQLETLISGVASATTAELNVVTISSLHGQTVEEYANTLFNQWRIGRADTNNGVLFLIAPNERRVRIEVGYGLEPLLTDGICGDILAAQVLPAFRAGHYSDGVEKGTEAIANLLRQHPEEAKGLEGSAPKFLYKNKKMLYLLIQKTKHLDLIVISVAHLFLGLVICCIWQISRIRKKYSFISVILATVTLIAIICMTCFALFFVAEEGLRVWIYAVSFFSIFFAIGNVTSYKRFRPRSCRECRNRMVLLRREERKNFLSEGERKEEELHSVDYDVWLCRSCDHTEKIPYLCMSTYKECQKCQKITIQEKETVLTPATTASTGLARVDSLCLACGNEFTRKKVLPREISSSDSSSSSSSSDSSSSSSSSDGGSSGGGGASGDW